MVVKEETRTVDILAEPSQSRLRKEILNICDSYSHPWDVLAELCQNSVDAIRRHRKLHGSAQAHHQISVVIDGTDRSIEVRDTGTGLAADQLVSLLAPHGTDKEQDADEIGEKGVGLTYTIYMSDGYEIETRCETDSTTGCMRGAAAWKNGQSDVVPMFTYTAKGTSSRPDETFTRISLSGVEAQPGDEGDLFEQPVSVIVFWLRTRTALGDTYSVFDSSYEAPFSVAFTHVDKAGKRSERVLPAKYMLPQEFLSRKDVVFVDTELLSKLASFNDSQKRGYLHSKSLVKTGEVNRAGRWIRYYAFAAASRDIWTQICETQGFTVEEAGESRNLLEGVITTATRGMPTGVGITPPATGWAGYWPNFFILLQDDALRFDLGRKSLPGRTTGLLREIAKEIFNELYKLLRFAGAANPPIQPGPTEKWQRDQMFADLERRPDMSGDFSNFIKQPTGQEAGVVALFHELVGRGLLKGYYTYSLGYKMTYDEWGRYRLPKKYVSSKFDAFANASGMHDGAIIIEFKYAADDLLKDLETSTKYFADIDLLVCWDIDEAKFTDQGIGVQVVTDEDRFFYGSNYQLVWPAPIGQPMVKPVLALRQFTLNLAAQGLAQREES